jgi:hypothetical protein
LGRKKPSWCTDARPSSALRNDDALRLREAIPRDMRRYALDACRDAVRLSY